MNGKDKAEMLIKIIGKENLKRKIENGEYVIIPL